MRTILKHYPVSTLLGISLLVFWPVVNWYGHRLFSLDGEYWSLLALIAAVVLLRRAPNQRPADRIDLRPAVVTLSFYCLSYWFVPPLFRAMFAMLTLGALLTARRGTHDTPVAIWGLLLLALPVVASLQFYLGYPLRVMTGELSILLLKLNGYVVSREGVVLNWGDTLVSIDAPCSGIKMLWTGLFLCLVLAGAYRLKLLPTAYLLSMTLIFVIAGNALRVTSLFYVETGIVPTMRWAHDSIGMLTFVFIAMLVSWQAQRVSTRRGACLATACI